MSTLKILLTVLILFFSCSFAVAKPTDNNPELTPSVYDLLLKLENDLKEKQPQHVIASDIVKIKKAEEIFPVSHIPELNYLTGSTVENIPSTEISLLKNLTYFLKPLEVSLKTFLFLLLFYSFIFYFQSVDIHPTVKKLITPVVVGLTILPFLVENPLLMYLASGIGLIIMLILKKEKIALYLLIGLFLLIIAQTADENALVRLNSRSFLYTVKIERDGYAPHYLIKQIFQDSHKAILETVTSDLALGKLDAISDLKNFSTEDPTLKAILLNDYGYVAFLKGNYRKALSFFEKALKIFPAPQLEYNLYLTYSSLLKLDKANQLKEKLLKEGILLEKLPPIPLIFHVPATPPEYVFPIGILLGFSVGLTAGFLITRLLPETSGKIDPELLLIPGIKDFINSRVKFPAIVSILVLLINLTLGRLLCSI